MGASVVLDKVSFSYDGDGWQLDHLTLEVAEGEVVVITGPSGSGKSTVTRVINGLAPRFYGGELRGSVSIGGVDVREMPSWELGMLVGNVFQDPRSQFFSNEVAGEIAFGCENQGFERDRIVSAVESAARAAGVGDLLGANLHDLSYGMRQKVAVASAYAVDPDVYVMDEPSANLDREASMRLAASIRHLKEQGKTVIVAEHRLFYLSGIADRFVLVKEGTVVRELSGAEMGRMSPEEAERLGLRLANVALLDDRRRMTVPSGAFPGKAPVLLEVERLSKAFGRTMVLREVSLSCRAGEVLAIVGPNGVGKSTCAKVLAGLLKEDAGRVLLGGRRIAPRRRIGRLWYVPQDLDSQLFGEDLVDELTTGLPKPREAAEAAREILHQLGLGDLEGRHPSTLSGGQKQRLVLGVALFRSAPVIILDEPTSGLDGASMRRVAGIVRDVAAQGTAVMVITHDVEFAAACCDRAVRLEGGSVTDEFAVREPSQLLSAMGYVEETSVATRR